MSCHAKKECLMQYSGAPLPPFDNELDWEAETSGSDTTYFFSLYNVEIVTISVYEEDYTITIYGVFLDEKYRGQGLGRCMLGEVMLDIIPLGKKIRLQVSDSNKPAFRLYTEYGFEIIDSVDATE